MMEYWEYKQYSDVLVKRISRYDLRIGIMSIFKFVSNKVISFSVKFMKYSFKKILLLW